MIALSHTLTQCSPSPTSQIQLTSRCAEKHLPHGPLASCTSGSPPGPTGPSAPGHGVQGASCCSGGLAFLGPQPSSFIAPRGRGGGHWHAMPSIDRPTSTWLAFLPERAKERVSLSCWDEGAGKDRRGALEAGEWKGRCQGHSAQPYRIPEWSM